MHFALTLSHSQITTDDDSAHDAGTAPGGTPFYASKVALHSIAEGLSMELQPLGIKDTHVAPGGVKSSIFKGQSLTFKHSPMLHYVECEGQMVEMTSLVTNERSMDMSAGLVVKALATYP